MAYQMITPEEQKPKIGLFFVMKKACLAFLLFIEVINIFPYYKLELCDQFAAWQVVILCRVYTCRFDNQVPNKKTCIKVLFCDQARAIFCLRRG